VVVSDDNSVPYLLDPLKAALDAVHAVGWALHAGIDVELPAGGGYAAHPIEALDCRPSFWGICPYHLRAPSGGPASDLVGMRPGLQRPGVRKSREGGYDGHDTDGVAW
jgi:hypothetical protein